MTAWSNRLHCGLYAQLSVRRWQNSEGSVSDFFLAIARVKNATRHME
jgi:hypothetical protein